MKNKTTPLTGGFTLPAILIVSTALFVIGLATIQSAVSIQSSVKNQYYNKLVQEAAEAGTAYAYACLEANNHLQTWTNPLTQKTDCTGTNKYSYTSILPSSSPIKSTFSVGNLEVSSTNTYLVVATGTINIMNTSGTATIKSFTQTLKKSVSWQNLVPGKSSSGKYRTCGLVSGSAYCWGQNNYGQLGDGTTTNSLVPVKVVRNSAVLGSKIVTDIASGAYHNCVIAAGDVYCWGLNSSGQLGNNSTTNSSVPVMVSGLPAGATTNVATSQNASCAVASGEAYCWGNNSSGQLGISSTTNKKVATKVTQTSGILLGKTVTSLATAGSSSDHMCAIANALAYCWGLNTSGQLGDNSTTQRTAPVAVNTTTGLTGVTAISADGQPSSPLSYSTCAVANSAAYCWGQNYNGKIGNNSNTNTTYKIPQAVSTSGVLAAKTVSNIVVGISHACAIASDKAYCWGDDTYGQLGDNKAAGTKSAVPVAVSEVAGAFLGQTITNLGGGANRACASANSKNYCWGWNGDGQIGDGTTTERDIPTESIFLRPKNNIFIF